MWSLLRTKFLKQKKKKKEREKGERRYFRIIDVTSAFYLVLLSACPWCSFRFGGRDGIPSGCNSYGNYELTRALGHTRGGGGEEGGVKLVSRRFCRNCRRGTRHLNDNFASGPRASEFQGKADSVIPRLMN